MRISDWSSDVCSSDLTRRCRQRNLLPLFRQQSLHARCTSGALFRSVYQPYRERNRSLSGGRMGSQVEVLADHGRRCLSGYRSEEHTSELQSLMHISYAVFCLKKKKRMNIESMT